MILALPWSKESILCQRVSIQKQFNCNSSTVDMVNSNLLFKCTHAHLPTVLYRVVRIRINTHTVHCTFVDIPPRTVKNTNWCIIHLLNYGSHYSIDLNYNYLQCVYRSAFNSAMKINRLIVIEHPKIKP